MVQDPRPTGRCGFILGDMHRLYCLGESRLVGPTGDPQLAGRRKELVLLAYLAGRSPRGVPRAELVDLLWGDRDETRARHSLRQALVELKRVLGDALEADRNEIRVRPGSIALDTQSLAGHIAAGELALAVEVFGGEFLPDTEHLGTARYRHWLDTEREVLRRQMEWALDGLVTEAERRQAWPDVTVCPSALDSGLTPVSRASVRLLLR